MVNKNVLGENLLTEQNCSNIKIYVHVAHPEQSVFMTILSFQIRFQDSTVYYFWLSRFRQVENQASQKGYILALDLAFDSKLLRNICENEETATHELGSMVAKFLKHRLADLRAAMSVNDLLVGDPRVVEDEKLYQHMIIDLSDGYHLLFCANHPNNPVIENGKIDWPKVSRIKILRIERNYV